MTIAFAERRHETSSALLLAETVGLWLALLLASFWTMQTLEGWARLTVLTPLVVTQGLWLDRLFTVAHEAVHRKLFPRDSRLNDVVGTALLLPIGAPFTVNRRVHLFHHGANRRDERTAALDHFRLPLGAGRWARARGHLVWLWMVFGGGFFLHSVATILLFLAGPTERLGGLSPVFKGWGGRSRLKAWAEFGAAAALHGGFALTFGSASWFACLCAPLLVFAWVWSVMLYVYHHETPVGPDVRANVRSLRPHPAVSWLLLNFSEHATHHRDPSLPWYALREQSSAPDERRLSLWQAIARQARGPIFYVADPR